MSTRETEKTITTFLQYGAIFSTVFLLSKTVTDPVNAPKMAAVGGLGFAALAIVIFRGWKRVYADSKIFLIIIALFILAMLTAVLSSEGPLTQNLYGVYGRNNGFIFYLSLAFLATATLFLREKRSFEKLILALYISGIINLVYCAWVLIFGDFIGWSNPYGKILGLFGNPDFISAFLGIFGVSVIAYIVGPIVNWKLRIIGIIVFAISIFEIKKSNAIQGLAVSAAGVAIVGFYWTKSKFKGRTPLTLYSLIIFCVGALALEGALQKGPLAHYIYKVSVSLRGQYWKAGINIGNSHPFTGVGMDVFGDWYRSARTEYAATVLPGHETLTNVAHNVVIDFFASGGWPLLVTYLGTIALGGIAIVKLSIRSKAYDKVFVALATGWIGYELQSIISINQAGLAIWGWLFLGALVAYEIATRETETDFNQSEKKSFKVKMNASTDAIFSPQLVGGLGLILGLLISIPPLAGDMAWKSAQISQQLPKFEHALQPSYLRPEDSNRYAQAVQILEQSNLPDQAYKYAKKAVKFNPNYFTAWEQLYNLKNSSTEDRKEALTNMNRLDPYLKQFNQK